MDDEIAKIVQILVNNSDKSFVKRIMNPKKYGTLKNRDGSVSTHSMAWGETDDGRVFVYPTVLMQKNGTLKRYGNEEAWRHTQETGNFIEFPTRDEADWFTKNYKRVWRSTNRR